MDGLHIIWDLEDDPDGNYWHIIVEGHGLTRDETEEILRQSLSQAVTSDSSGEPISFVWTSTGKYIAVVFEHVLDDPVTVYPITAYTTTPPKTRKRQRKRK